MDSIEVRLIMKPRDAVTQLEIMEAAHEIESLRRKLAAALAACEAKDTILRGITLYRAFNGDDWPAREATQALAIKPDSSALKAPDDALIEKIAAFVETQRNDVPACGFEFANTIRELKGTL